MAQLYPIQENQRCQPFPKKLNLSFGDASITFAQVHVCVSNLLFERIGASNGTTLLLSPLKPSHPSVTTHTHTQLGKYVDWIHSSSH